MLTKGKWHILEEAQSDKDLLIDQFKPVKSKIYLKKCFKIPIEGSQMVSIENLCEITSYIYYRVCVNVTFCFNKKRKVVKICA